ncbi:MAG TPA: biopolymer transporter ExbD [Thermoanaerobaculia bacterium]|nr:biopolymer transporter ExbD [Thermoanaerobaculia bacterium]
MSMAAVGGAASGGYKSDINITPLVDIVLVLLIIFMVITPLLQMGYDVKVPPKATVESPPPSVDQLIVSVTPQGRIYLNKEQVDAQSLALRLGEILKNRRDKTVFFSADDSVNYGDVARTMDIVRNADPKGVRIGIVLETVPVEGITAAPPAPAAVPAQ